MDRENNKVCDLECKGFSTKRNGTDNKYLGSDISNERHANKIL